MTTTLGFILGFFAGIVSIIAPVAFLVWRADRLLDETGHD